MTDDPYTIQSGRTREPPTSLFGRLRYLGPGIIVSGSIVGSGEILLTATLGATVGFVLLWWVLFSCWVKSLVQAGCTSDVWRAIRLGTLDAPSRRRSGC